MADKGLIQKIRAGSDIDQKGHFFETKCTKNFTTLYSILFLSVLHQNKALHNFPKTVHHLIAECLKGLDQGLLIGKELLIINIPSIQFWVKFSQYKQRGIKDSCNIYDKVLCDNRSITIFTKNSIIDVAEILCSPLHKGSALSQLKIYFVLKIYKIMLTLELSQNACHLAYKINPVTPTVPLCWEFLYLQ